MIRKYTRLDCVVVFFVDARYMGDLLIELKNKRIICSQKKKIWWLHEFIDCNRNADTTVG